MYKGQSITVIIPCLNEEHGIEKILRSMPDFVDEKDCLLCSHVPPKERDAFRGSLDTMPLDEPVCDACAMAFWRNFGLPVRDDDDTKR